MGFPSNHVVHDHERVSVVGRPTTTAHARTFELNSTVKRSRMSTKISFLRPLRPANEMGLWTALEGVVLALMVGTLNVALRAASTTIGSLYTCAFSSSVDVPCG